MEQEKKKRRRRKAKPHNVKIPVDRYFCEHCQKEHIRGIDSNRRFVRHYILFRKQEAVGKLLSKKEVAFQPLPEVSFEGKAVKLDAEKRAPAMADAEAFIKQRIIGQEQAISSFVNLTAKVSADICDPMKPRGIYLLLGPTGVGKTRIVETLAEYYFGSRKKMVKVNCGELATMFSFKKFGGRLFTDNNVMLETRDGLPLGIILLDEIEKATVLLYKLLLGILDRATLRIDEEDVDLSHTIVVMTSNLGAQEIMAILSRAKNKITAEVAARMKNAALNAAQERFSPEFFNRVDDVIVFRPLLRDQLKQIAALEISSIEQRLVAHDIRLHCTDLATDLILDAGTDSRYGARHLRRTLEQVLVQPIANMLMSGELTQHSKVKVIAKDGQLGFRRVE